MDYVGSLLVFLGVLIAIRGETWDKDTTGIRRVTLTGWLTAILATAGVIVAVVTTRDSKRSAYMNEQRLVIATREAASANATVQELRGRLAVSQRVVTEVRDMSERQPQMVMAEYVTLRPGQVWHAPNSVFPGSIVKFMMWDVPILLEYGERRVSVRSSDDDPVEIAIIGSSGASLPWLLRNSGDQPTAGKVYLYSSPRGRSAGRSWAEERADPNRFFGDFIAYAFTNDRKPPAATEYQCREADDEVIVLGRTVTKVLSCWVDYGPDRSANAATRASALKSRFFRFIQSDGLEPRLSIDRSQPGWTNEIYALVPRRETADLYVQYEAEANHARTTGYAKLSLLIGESE